MLGTFDLLAEGEGGVFDRTDGCSLVVDVVDDVTVIRGGEYT